MNVFGIGLPELAVIAAIGLLVFGPKRLPELGKTLGRTLKGFQSASTEFEKEFRSAIAASDLAPTDLQSTALDPADLAAGASAEIAVSGVEPAPLASESPASADPVPAGQSMTSSDGPPAT